MMELPTPPHALIHLDRNALRSFFSDTLKLKRDINQGHYQIQQRCALRLMTKIMPSAGLLGTQTDDKER